MAVIKRARQLLWASPSLSSIDEAIDLESGINVQGSYRDTIHTGLKNSLIRSKVRVGLLDECWKWFCCFLDSSIKRDWEQVLSGVIKELDPFPPTDATKWPEPANNVYQVLKTVTEAISSRQNISIDGIYDELMSGTFLRKGEEDGVHGPPPSQDQVRQMIWCLVGLVTMLYDPKPQLNGKQLCLQLPASGLRSSGFSRPGEISCGQQEIVKSRWPLHNLLAQFGDIMPKVEVDQQYLSSMDVDHINITYMNFYTLKYVANVEIEWVNTLNLHLQLDKRRRILRLFRFPAFCRLLWTDNEESFMKQIFSDHRKARVDADLDTEHTFSDYVREVLLSYRLLFGIDKKSRHAFKAELPAWRAGLPGANYMSPQELRNSNMDDPLLLLLCTTTTTTTNTTTNGSRPSSSSTSASVTSRGPTDPLADLLYSLHGEEKSPLYDLEDFPFLGRRLADIQRFSLKQKPNDLKTLFLIDRRDPQSFWNGWIAWFVLAITIGTLILAFLQTIFQIWGTFPRSGTG